MASGTILVEDEVTEPKPIPKDKKVPVISAEETTKHVKDIMEQTARAQSVNMEGVVSLVTNMVTEEVNESIREKIKMVLGITDEKREIDICKDAEKAEQIKKTLGEHTKYWTADEINQIQHNKDREKLKKEVHETIDFMKRALPKNEKTIMGAQNNTFTRVGDKDSPEGKTYDIDGAIDRLLCHYIRYGLEIESNHQAGPVSIPVLKEISKFHGSASCIDITEITKLVAELAKAPEISGRREALQKLRNILLDYVYPEPRKERKTKNDLMDEDVKGMEKDIL
jgi:hypothetical protein